MRVLLDTAPLTNQNQIRGVGTYTAQLLAGLRNLRGLDEPLVIQATHEVGPIEQPHHHFDVVHYPYFDLFFDTLPSKAPVATVVTVHDVIPLIFPQQYQPGLRGRWRYWQQKRRLSQIEMVVTDSECSKQDIIKHLRISPNQIEVIPLAASPQLQPASEYYQQKVRQDFNLPSKYILYIGDINYNKNLPTLLLALTQLATDVHLCVVSATFNNSDIPEGAQLAKIIDQNDIAERVHVLSVSKDEPEVLSAIIAGSRALVQPSLYEGFGLPVLEAMQVGTVVVSANTASLPEVASDAAILVEPTITGLADGIAQAVALRGDERQAQIERGRRRATHFSWEKTAKLTYDAYRTAVRRFAGEQV